MKEVGGADPADVANAGAAVLVVARRENPAAPLRKGRDAGAIDNGQAVASVDADEPELIEIGCSQFAQYWIVGDARSAIARHDLHSLNRVQHLGQPREAPDVPVV